MPFSHPFFQTLLLGCRNLSPLTERLRVTGATRYLAIVIVGLGRSETSVTVILYTELSKRNAF